MGQRHLYWRRPLLQPAGTQLLPLISYRAGSLNVRQADFIYSSVNNRFCQVNRNPQKSACCPNPACI